MSLRSPSFRIWLRPSWRIWLRCLRSIVFQTGLGFPRSRQPPCSPATRSPPAKCPTAASRCRARAHPPATPPDQPAPHAAPCPCPAAATAASPASAAARPVPHAQRQPPHRLIDARPGRPAAVGVQHRRGHARPDHHQCRQRDFRPRSLARCATAAFLPRTAGLAALTAARATATCLPAARPRQGPRGRAAPARGATSAACSSIAAPAQRRRGVERLEQARLRRELAQQAQLAPLRRARWIRHRVEVDLLRRRQHLHLCLRRAHPAQRLVQHVLRELIVPVVHRPPRIGAPRRALRRPAHSAANPPSQPSRLPVLAGDDHLVIGSSGIRRADRASGPRYSRSDRASRTALLWNVTEVR